MHVCPYVGDMLILGTNIEIITFTKKDVVGCPKVTGGQAIEKQSFKL